MSSPIPSFVYKAYARFPFDYVNGLGLSNNATTPNTKLDVAAGSTIDSTLEFQVSTSATITIDAATNGLNGLDTGTFAASTVYAVFLVWDPVTANTPGAMISTSYTAPLLPFGYSAFKLIGYATTDASVHFLKGYWTAGGISRRVFMYDAPQATAITAGAATSYTAIDLTTLVPLIDNQPVWINSAFTPNAASDTLKLQPQGATGDAVIITAQVASVVVTTQSYLLSKIASSKPEIAYKVSAGTDAAAINVAGYEFSL